ncbi:MAG: UDP-N-acetylmuramoyl-L-alanine--D-glutamate ligase [Planctomycetaceae bacterium]
MDNRLHKKRITVMGLGSFGGGLGAVQFLIEQNARVSVTDTRPADQLAESLAQLDLARLESLTLGRHDPRDFTDADLIVVNPAIKRDHPLLELARRHGVPLTSEMNLFWQYNRGRILAVTGSNGKSTTTAMSHAILQAAGYRCWLGGNIGRSLLPIVEQITADDWVVLELSSFQLHDLNLIGQSPDVAIVTNFSPNHLDWHGTLDEYRKDKQAMLRWQMPHQIAVLNETDVDVRDWPTNGRRFGFGSTLAEASEKYRRGIFLDGRDAIYCDSGGEVRFPLLDWITLPGRHNLQNALAAACAAMSIGVPVEAVEKGLRGYQPLPHRLEFVAEVAGRRFYNDSLATTPESAMYALEAFDAPIVLLAGGYDKQVDLSEFARVIAGRAKGVALMGQTATMIDDGMRASGLNSLPQRKICASFAEAFAWSISQSEVDDVIVLSPGCASYDWFRNFADRGQQFTRLVEDYRQSMPAANRV